MLGTPIQNNIEELFSLLNFMQPLDFDDQDTFVRKYGNFNEILSQ